MKKKTINFLVSPSLCLPGFHFASSDPLFLQVIFSPIITLEIFYQRVRRPPWVCGKETNTLMLLIRKGIVGSSSSQYMVKQQFNSGSQFLSRAAGVLTRNWKVNFPKLKDSLGLSVWTHWGSCGSGLQLKLKDSISTHWGAPVFCLSLKQWGAHLFGIETVSQRLTDFVILLSESFG